MRRVAGAFTLIEVIVSLVISAALMSVVLGILAGALRDGRRARLHSEMMRDADLVSHLLNTELRMAGAGVPASDHIDVLYGTSPPAPILLSVLVNAADQVGVLGDLPRPDANYGAFGPIHTRPTGAITAIAWHNENNGACMPDGGGSSCVAGRDSLFFPDNAAHCDASGSGAPFSDRTCPWGMRRTLPGERIVIAAGNGTWSHAQLTGAVQRLAAAAGLASVTSAKLNPGYTALQPGGPPFVPVWPNFDSTDGPGGIAGQGFVSTPDRVFFKQLGTTIVRRQCWGDPDPNDVDWPTGNAVPASPQLAGAGGVQQNQCTDEEVVARNVLAFALSYFDTGGNPVAPKAQVRRIDYTIDFSAVSDARPVTHRVRGSVRLSNLP